MNNMTVKETVQAAKCLVSLSKEIFPVDLRYKGVDTSLELRLKLYNGSITNTHTTWRPSSGQYIGNIGTGDDVLNSDSITEQFNLSASDIVKAIIQKKASVIERAQDANFRFPSNTGGDLINASDLSEAFAILLAATRSDIAKKGAAKSNERRKSKADDYAYKVFDQYEKIKSESKGALTLQKAAELLTERGIKTPTGKGQWHSATLVPLQKRWRKLGLIPDKPKP